jgi:hypothetical protein
MTRENLKDIPIFFKIVVPQTYEEFSGLFPGVFDELENPDHVWGNMGLRSISVDFRRLRKSMGLIGKKRKLFTGWMTRYLNEHRQYWNLYGGTCKAYAEDENFEYDDRRWILIGRRHVTNSENIDPDEHKIEVTY